MKIFFHCAIIIKYKQGYFEIKCICNKGGDFWSAFWIQADHPYTPEISKGGIGGAELDIFEANGVSQVEEQVLVSLCIPQKMSKNKEKNKDTFSTEFIVDYVKIYQKV